MGVAEPGAPLSGPGLWAGLGGGAVAALACGSPSGPSPLHGGGAGWGVQGGFASCRPGIRPAKPGRCVPVSRAQRLAWLHPPAG